MIRQGQGTINIIDTTSTEFNRGSFCYAPYLLYNGINKKETKINFIEAFKSEDIDNIPDADAHIVTLWSYPQIEVAFLLNQILPYMTGKDNVYFIGYTPLIQELGLKPVSILFGFDPLSDPTFLKLAMKHYPDNYPFFDNLLLSDCDMHFKNLEEEGEKVYPLFTSYGCPNGCTFCPSTKNCGFKRTVLSDHDVGVMLDKCEKQNVKYIHFTDEDFFFDIHRAWKILTDLKGKGFHLIALGSANKVYEFIKEYGTAICEEAGLEVVEIGFESGDEMVSSNMGAGKDLNACDRIAKIQKDLPFKVLWLVLTFFPGETIRSLNKTGQFMKMNGSKMEEMVGRLRTNGTKGGLGQFFQPYHGLKMFNKLKEQGIFLTERQIRLIPSYIPYSFLYSPIQLIRENLKLSALPWLRLYNIDIEFIDRIKTGYMVEHYITGKTQAEQIHNIIAIAILARMEVIV